MSYQQIIPAVLLSACFGSIYSTSPLLAQIIPDSTLGNENSIVTPNATVKEAIADVIEGGVIRDSNLFHSFTEFNIPDGNNVYFANPDGIANILTRVTGNNISEIFGTLGVDGAANLFLLNPNGIVFGENASLDVAGSFLATTADSYIFENGFKYSASNPNIPPLLTVNIPIGLQMGHNPAAIEVQGKGNNLIFEELDDNFSIITDNRPVGLEVNRDRSLTLLGGEINLKEGNLTGSGGRVELGAVGASERVDLNPTDDGFSLDYGENTNFENINLTQAASIDASGRGAGNIQLRGKNISLLENSAIIANTLGADNGGEVDLFATDSIEIIASDSALLGIFSEVSPEATGKGANLTIESNSLLLKEGAEIAAKTVGAGDSGNLTVNVSEIEVIGTASDNSSPSGLFSSSQGKGNAGDLTINGDFLIVRDGAIIDSGTVDAGDSGNLTVNVSEIEVVGTDSDLFPSGLFSSSESTGNAGDLTLNGDRLIVREGARIDSGNFAIEALRDPINFGGNSGNLTVNVSQIEIINTNPDQLVSSGLFSPSVGKGNGGNLTINGDFLIVKGAAQIISGNFGTGKGGNLTVNVSQIELIDSTANRSAATGIFASSFGTGNTGDLTINGDRLSIRDGAKITSATIGEGKGGNLTVNASEIEIIGTITTPNESLPSGLFSSSFGKGNAGDLTINGETLIVKDGGVISSSTLDVGNAGDIDITAKKIEVTGTSPDGNLLSNITASSEADSPAGSLDITTDRLNVTDNAEIVVNNTNLGDAGNLNIIANEINLDNGGSLNAEVNQGEQGNINLITNNIVLNHHSQIDAKAFNNATGGNISIDNTENILLRGNSQINANAFEGNGGNIKINTQGFFVSADSLVTASSDFGLDGNVEVETINSKRNLELATLPTNPINIAEKITTGCNSQSDFALVGTGGLPQNPNNYLRGEAIWQDLRLVAIDSKIILESDRKMSKTPSKTIVEAQDWKINDFGKIELIAINSTSVTRNDDIGCYSLD